MPRLRVTLFLLADTLQLALRYSTLVNYCEKKVLYSTVFSLCSDFQERNLNIPISACLQGCVIWFVFVLQRGDILAVVQLL